MNHRKKLLAAALAAALLALPAPAAQAASGTPTVNCGAAVLMEKETGTILYEQNSHDKLEPASVTKIMTLLLVMEAVDSGRISLDQTVTISAHAVSMGGSQIWLKEGEQMTVHDLLKAVAVVSANDGAVALAELVAGSEEGFVALMNQRAAELGMTNTHFANTHGYHDDNHYTSAYDVFLMCQEAMKHETFRTIVTTKSYDMPATNIHPEVRTVHSTNALISNWNVTGYLYSYATGIKTGHTNESGYCLAAAATKEDRSLISVVMGCEREPGTSGSKGRTDFSETIRLFEWGFNNFSTQTILDATKRDIPEIEVTLGKGTNYVTLEPQGEISALLPNDISTEDFKYDYTLNANSVEAPVEKGQVLGTITASFNGKEYGSLPLVASIGVEVDTLMYNLDRIQKFFSQLWVKILLVILLVVILFFIVRRLIFGGRRGSRRGGYSYSGGSRYSGRRRRR